MTLDPVTNFGKVIVSIGYDSSSTSIVLQTGHGAKLPDPVTYGAFNLVWWNFTDYPDPSDDPNVEIVRCIIKSTDTLTLIRAQEGISASTKNTIGKTYKMILSLTKKMINDINTDITTVSSTISIHTSATTAHGVSSSIVGTTDNQTLTNKTITDLSNYVMARYLKSLTTSVDVSASAAPTVGQMLTATSSTAATWQTPSVPIGVEYTANKNVANGYVGMTADGFPAIIIPTPTVYQLGNGTAMANPGNAIDGNLTTFSGEASYTGDGGTNHSTGLLLNFGRKHRRFFKVKFGWRASGVNSGHVYIEQSPDNSSWTTLYDSGFNPGSTEIIVTTEAELSDRYFRIRFGGPTTSGIVCYLKVYEIY